MITEVELFVSADLIPSDFCLWALLKSEVSKIHKTNCWSKYGCYYSHKETWRSTL